MEQSIIAKINKVPIVIFDREKLVPIKPICDALGVNFPSQYSKIKEDDILNSTVVLSTTVGGDKKIITTPNDLVLTYSEQFSKIFRRWFLVIPINFRSI